MGTTDWTQLWLNYHRAYEGEGTWNIALEGFESSDAVVSNAICEFKKAVVLLTGEQVTDTADSSSRSLTLKITNDAEIPAEGYAISNIRVIPTSITLAGSEVAIAPYREEGAALFPYDPVDISGQSRTVSQLLYLNTPGNMDYISNNTVQVVVTILPEEFVKMSTDANP